MTERITAEQVHGWAECLFSISREDGGLEDFYPQEMANDLDRLSRQLAQDEQRIAGFQSDAQQLNNALEDERCARAVVAAKSGRAEARVRALEQELEKLHTYCDDLEHDLSQRRKEANHDA